MVDSGGCCSTLCDVFMLFRFLSERDDVKSRVEKTHTKKHSVEKSDWASNM